MTTTAEPVTPLDGLANPTAFPFDRDPNPDVNGNADGNMATRGGLVINNIQWPPTPREPSRTPERTPPRPRPQGQEAARPRMESPTGGRRSERRARTMPASTDDLLDDADLNAYEHRHDGPKARAHAKIRSYEDRLASEHYPRISRPVELLRPSYDVVVIGSGYGGGVAASRMARAGQSVCLLELGKERWPGEYPAHTGEAFSELHCSGQLSPGCLPSININSGQPTGMYHLIFGKGQNVVVCNGRSLCPRHPGMPMGPGRIPGPAPAPADPSGAEC